MGRAAKPWYWKERNAWYVTVKGKRHRLAEGKASRNEAYRAFLELDKQSEGVATSRSTAESVCTMFVEHAKVNLKPNTYEGYKRFLEPFTRNVRSVDANDVQPRMVTKFLDEHPRWGRTTRFNAITAIKRAWSWAHSEGHLTLNQLTKMKRPKPRRREEIPDDGEVDLFIKTAKPSFQELLIFIREVGCRPGEATMMERRHVDLPNREVRFKIGEDKTSGKTDRPRVIHLSDKAVEILQGLVAQHPTGPLFRNSAGRAWNRHSINCAVRKIRERTHLDGRAVVYALRHQWATDALARGVPLSLVAEMMGNSPEIVARVYSHLSDKKALLLKAANQVRPPVADLSL